MPKFIDNRNEDLTYSTADYWEKFTIFMILHQKNIDFGTIQATDLTDDEKVYLNIARAAFLNSIGDVAVNAIKTKNSKVKTAEKDLSWLKSHWEDIWKAEDSQSQKFVNVFQTKREKSETVQWFSTRTIETVARCKLEP